MPCKLQIIDGVLVTAVYALKQKQVVTFDDLKRLFQWLWRCLESSRACIACIFNKSKDFSLDGGTVTVSGGRRPKISIRALYISSAVPSKNFPQPAMNRVSPVYNVDIKTGLLIPFVIICQAVKIMLFLKGINTCIHYGMHSVDQKWQ